MTFWGADPEYITPTTRSKLSFAPVLSVKCQFPISYLVFNTDIMVYVPMRAWPAGNTIFLFLRSYKNAIFTDMPVNMF